MRRLFVTCSILLAFLSWVSAAALKEPTSADLEQLVELYKGLHRSPELSYQEEKTSELVARHLEDYGFEVTRHLGRYRDQAETAFGVVGVLKNGEGPTVMVRTDMDGLPVDEKTGLDYMSTVKVRTERGVETGVMHACGHDVHMSVFLGTAKVLSENRDAWKGTLVLIGQPAEERGAGALAMLNDGLYERFPRPDYALALHVSADLPAGKIGYRPGFVLASVDSVDIRVRGMGGHGAYPHRTKDPIVLASQIVLALQTIVSRTVSPLDPAVVTVGSIHGGAKHNVIPDFVDLQLTVRTYKPEVRKVVLDSIRRIAAGTAKAAGIPDELAPVVKISEGEYTPSTYNDPGLVQRLVPVWKSELGDANVVEVDPVMAGEDFSRYRLNDEIPTCIFWLGAVNPERVTAASQDGGEPLPPLHSSQFAPDPKPTLRTGIRAMTATVLEILGKQ